MSFFAYPGKPSDLVPDGLHRAPGGRRRATTCPARWRTWPSRSARRAGGAGRARRPTAPTGPPARSPRETSAPPLGALLPEGPSCRRGQHAGLFARRGDRRAPRHDWLCLTGGAIGQGLPVATGAAVAAPDRRVVCLEADGSAMYTLQSLWTQAREGLDVTTVFSTTTPTPS